MIMRAVIALVLLLPLACSRGPSGKTETALESQTKTTPAEWKPASPSGMCEQDPACKADLERWIAGRLSAPVDLLAEIDTYYSRNAVPPDEEGLLRELKTIRWPASASPMTLWATSRMGSGACFTIKLSDAATGKIAWTEESLCDVRTLILTEADTLLKIAARPPADSESHAAPRRLQFTYYAWDVPSGVFKKNKSLETRERY